MSRYTFKETNIEAFKKYWRDKQWKPSDRFNLYIDGPFCVQQCGFCIHRGDRVSINSPIYNRYYKEYIPYLLELFEEVLSFKVPDSIYFGGGTANLMTTEIMVDLFKQIPNMKEIPYKVMEGHPAFMTKEKIDILADYNFSYISLGLQTLDMSLLKRHNRIPHKPEKLKHLIRYCQEEKKVHVNCDLLTFINKGNAEDIQILKNDLKLLMEEYGPNLITIYPEYQGFSKNYTDITSFSIKEMDEAVTKIRSLRRGIMSQVRKKPRYNLLKENRIELNDEAIKEFLLDDYYIGKLSQEEFKKFHQYCCSSFPFHPPEQNVLGIGGYSRRKPYSYLGREHYFTIENKDWQPKIFKQMEDK